MRLQTVHIRVNEESTGKPTACRIRVTDSSGQEYAPFGQYLDFPTHRGESVGGRVKINGARWFSIPGACEIALPPGELRVQVRKGISCVPINARVSLPAGKMALRFALERCLVVPKPHMKTIDTRCHLLSPHDAELDAAAEDIDIVNVLAEPITNLGIDGNPYTSTPNLNAFSGQMPCIDKMLGARVFVNTHNRHAVLGSLGLLDSHRPVFPLTFGAPVGTDDWSLRDWAGQCHRKGGLVVWTEPFSPRLPHAGEALALAVLGEIDAYEFSPGNVPHALRGWYQLLLAGISLPIVGGSARDGNSLPVGAMQTSLYADENDWAESVRLAVPPSVTNGPNASVIVDEKMVYASAISLAPFDRVELIANGQKIAEGMCKDTGCEFVANIDYEFHEEGWFAARVLDTRKSFLDEATPLFAHTSAKFFGTLKPSPDARALLRDQLTKSRAWVEDQGRFDDPKSKTKLLDTFNEAIGKLA